MSENPVSDTAAPDPGFVDPPEHRVEVFEPGEVLGRNCPVTPLGYNGDRYFFLDSSGQLRATTARAMSAAGVLDLFGGSDAWLLDHCSLGKRGEAKSDGKPDWNNVRAQKLLMRACKMEGAFDPTSQQRGPGVWVRMRDTGPGLLVHRGDRVFEVVWGAEDAAGGRAMTLRRIDGGRVIDGAVYAQAPARPPLAERGLFPEDFELIWEHISSWNWQDPDVDPTLLLGWAALSTIAAAVPARPVCFVVGDSGCGKSSVRDFLEDLNGSANVVTADDATRAGITGLFTRLGHPAAPVLLDEQEWTEATAAKIHGLVEMSRHSFYPGRGEYLRGGSDGYATRVEAAFYFGAIQAPELEPQDLNRAIVLNLGPLGDRDVEDFDGRAEDVAALGPAFRHTVLAVWPMLEETCRVFRKGLRGGGHDPRSADRYSVLLALAHLVKCRGRPSQEDVDHWVAVLAADTGHAPGGERHQHELCLDYLKGARVDLYGTPGRKQVGWAVSLAIWGSQWERDIDPVPTIRALENFGIKIVGAGPDARVMVANTLAGPVFAGSAKWSKGGWAQLLARLDGAARSDGSVRFAGSRDRAVMLPGTYFEAPEGVG